jgi:hypothetical protein
MHKTLMLALVLLFSSAWLQAQEGSSSGTSGLTTVLGCLHVSGGRYSVTDSNGTTHQLTGYANKLKNHVGHEVEITGTPSTRTASTTAQGAASTATQQQVLRVKSIKHVGDVCKTN